MKRTIILLFYCFCASFLSAQTGAWMPANADYSYPRTLCKLAELDSIRDYLLLDEPYHLYQNLYARALNYNSPAVLSDDSRRRIAAHIAKDAAFIYLLNRKPVGGGALDTLTTAEGIYFRDKSISYMERMNTDVEAFPTGFDAYLWRSNEIADNLIAYDLLKGAGVSTSLLDSSRGLNIQYLSNLYEEATYELFGFGFFTSRTNNHAIRSASVFGLGAVILNDVVSSDPSKQPINWLSVGLGNQDNVLFEANGRQTEPGVLSGYAEGPHYLKFGAKHLLEFNHAMGNFLPDSVLQISFNGGTRQIRNPWYDPRYDLLWEWMTRIRMPDGRMPPLEDSFTDHGFPEMALTEQSRFNAPFAFSRWNPVQTIGIWKQLKSSTDDLIPDYLAARTPPMPDTFPHVQALPDAGSLIFRSGWDTNAVWYHMYAQHGNSRTNGVGHNQADVGSFMIQAYGEYLAFDPGYLKWDRRNEVGRAQHHNMILVNGAGPNSGAIGSSGGADGFIDHHYDGKFLDFGNVRTEYQGAKINRNSMFLRERYILLGDLAESINQGTMSFEWRLHGAGLEGGDSLSGIFTTNPAEGWAKYKKNEVTLLAQVIASGNATNYTRQAGGHEISYDTLEQHTTFLVQEQGMAQTAFLTALVPYEQDSAQVVPYTTTAGPIGFQMDWGSEIDFGFTETVPASLSGLSGDLQFSGGYGIYSQKSSGEFDCLAAGRPDTLSFPNGIEMFCEGIHFVMLERIDSVTYKGYVMQGQGPAKIQLAGLDFSPQSVWGGPVNGWSSLPNGAFIQIDGSGTFILHMDIGLASPEPENDIGLQVYPNPASSEVWIKRDSQGEFDFQILDVTGKVLISGKGNGIETRIGVSEIPQGVYHLVIRQNGTQHSEKITIVK